MPNPFGSFASLLAGNTSFRQLAYEENKKRIVQVFRDEFVFTGVCALLSLQHEDALLFLTEKIKDKLMASMMAEIDGSDMPSISKEDAVEIVEKVAYEFAAGFERYRDFINESGAGDQPTP